MLTGAAFFADRDEGLIWCDSCVPTEVIHLAAPPPERDGGGRRYVVIETGELLVSHILPRATPARRMSARCHTCGAIQPATPAGREAA